MVQAIIRSQQNLRTEMFTTAIISEFFFFIVISIKHCMTIYAMHVSIVYKCVVENAYYIKCMRIALAKKISQYRAE
jgi:hypothetical protein